MLCTSNIIFFYCYKALTINKLGIILLVQSIVVKKHYATMLCTSNIILEMNDRD